MLSTLASLPMWVRDAGIGNNCKIYPQVYLGDDVKLVRIVSSSGVRIYHECVIGNHCIIHAGSVIGADGFGFSKEGEVYKKIPQMGNVVLEDDVEVAQTVPSIVW